MTYLDEGDLDALIEDSGGEDVTIAGVTKKKAGLIRMADATMLEGNLVELVGKVIAVNVKTGLFPGLAINAPISFRGLSHRVRDFRQIEDGATTRVLCLRA